MKTLIVFAALIFSSALVMPTVSLAAAIGGTAV